MATTKDDTFAYRTTGVDRVNFPWFHKSFYFSEFLRPFVATTKDDTSAYRTTGVEGVNF